MLRRGELIQKKGQEAVARKDDVKVESESARVGLRKSRVSAKVYLR